MQTTRHWLAAGLLASSILVGCSAPAGIAIGGPADCGDRCQLYIDAGGHWLATTHSDHAPIVESGVFEMAPDGIVHDGRVVVVMLLADGTSFSAIVACGLGVYPNRCLSWSSAAESYGSG